ncbi:MAG TPA: hypothetical protein VJ807_11600, partial [Gaiellaceae bacterium]|nr:hypothetical protein [Gaiellaceae bacterium]
TTAEIANALADNLPVPKLTARKSRRRRRKRKTAAPTDAAATQSAETPETPETIAPDVPPAVEDAAA